MPEPPLPDDTTALFFDLDGTLIEVAAQPWAVQIPPELPASLAALGGALDGALAILSGRSVGDVDTLLHAAVRCVAGVHGAERRGASGALQRTPSPALAGVGAALAALADRHAALHLEHKPGAVALHYRQAPELEALCIATATAAVAHAPDLEIQRGKMVVEAKPRGVDKGRALQAFLAEHAFAGRRPWHFGDDRTDEAAFEVVRSLGGVAVKVGGGATRADHRLSDPAAVRAWLARATAHLLAARRVAPELRS